MGCKCSKEKGPVTDSVEHGAGEDGEYPAGSKLGHNMELQALDPDDPHNTPLPRPYKGASQVEREEYIAQKVSKAKDSIHQEFARLKEQHAYIQQNKRLPDEICDIVAGDALDAVGAMYCAVESLLEQKRVTEAKTGANELNHLNFASEYALKYIQSSLDRETEMLERATRTAVEEWQIDAAQYTRRISQSDLQAQCKTLPLAATDSKLKHFGPQDLSVQRLLGACVILNQLEKARVILGVYNQRRGEATSQLVPVILKDVRSYSAVLEKHLEGSSEMEASEKLKAMQDQVPQSLDGVRLSEKVVAKLTGLETESHDVAFAVHQRLVAATGSLTLYDLVCGIVSGVALAGPSPFVVPGGVKQLARMVFKTASKYGCNFVLCKDVIRCTVVTVTIVMVHDVVAAIFDSRDVLVIRMKHRLHKDYDATPIGGYLDCQLQVLFKSSDGAWLHGEVQVNLESMVAIKQQPNGGHAIFKYARSLAAYDEKTFKYSGSITPEVADQIKCGVVLDADFMSGCKDWAEMCMLCDALESPQCRLVSLDIRSNNLGDGGASKLGQALLQNTSLKSLRFEFNQIGDEGGKELGKGLKHNTSLKVLDLRVNQIGDEGAKGLGEALKHNKSLQELDLRSNQISDEGGKALGEALKHNESLQTLILRDNNIGVEGGKGLGEGLKHNKSLQTLNLRICRIRDEGCKALGEGLMHNKSLKQLDLRGSVHPRGEGADAVRAGWGSRGEKQLFV